MILNKITSRAAVLRNWIVGFSILLLTACGDDDPGSNADPGAISFSPPSGSAGDIVTIKGTNFGTSMGTVVSFNGEDASIISITNTEIVVSVPSTALTGKVTVIPAVVNSTLITSKTDFVINAGNKFSGGARMQAVTFVIGGKGYVALGQNEGRAKNDIWELDPSSKTWTQKAPFPLADRLGAFGFAINNKGYAGGGSEIDEDFYEYDPAANTWTKKASIGFKILNAGTFVINNKGYVVTGGDKYFFTGGKKLLEYDPATNVWSQKADFPGLARVVPIAFSINGKGYAGAGASNNFDTEPLSDFYEYDPAMNQWTKKADFAGSAKMYTSSFTFSTKACVGRGVSGVTGTRESWSYDPSANAWIKGADIAGAPRWFSFAFVIGNTAYIGGGRDRSNTYDDMREFK
jgi:N-acetylneuraminic acid mutarotase